MHLNLGRITLLESLDQNQVIIVTNDGEQFLQSSFPTYLLDESYSLRRTKHYSIASGFSQSPTVLAWLVQVEATHTVFYYSHPIAPPLQLRNKAFQQRSLSRVGPAYNR